MSLLSRAGLFVTIGLLSGVLAPAASADYALVRAYSGQADWDAGNRYMSAIATKYEEQVGGSTSFTDNLRLIGDAYDPCGRVVYIQDDFPATITISPGSADPGAPAATLRLEYTVSTTRSSSCSGSSRSYAFSAHGYVAGERADTPPVVAGVDPDGTSGVMAYWYGSGRSSMALGWGAKSSPYYTTQNVWSQITNVVTYNVE